MLPNFHQNVEDILKAAPPGFKLLWQHVRLLAAQNAAVKQLYYNGLIAGSEFVTYAAGKLYVAMELKIGYTTSVPAINNGNFALMNENNVLSFNAVNVSATYEGVGVTYPTSKNCIYLDNVYFGRVIASVYTYMIFNGFKLTW